jgi:hypothetical protein
VLVYEEQSDGESINADGDCRFDYRTVRVFADRVEVERASAIRSYRGWLPRESDPPEVHRPSDNGWPQALLREITSRFRNATLVREVEKVLPTAPPMALADSPSLLVKAEDGETGEAMLVFVGPPTYGITSPWGDRGFSVDSVRVFADRVELQRSSVYESMHGYKTMPDPPLVHRPTDVGWPTKVLEAITAQFGRQDLTDEVARVLPKT